MGADGGFRLRHFHDGVGEAFHNLGFGRAPRIVDVDRDVAFLEIFGAHAHELGGDTLAREVFGLLVGGVVGDGEHPAGGLVGNLGVDEVGNHHHVGLGFLHPILAGQAEIKHAVLNVEGDFLHAAEAGRDLGIVDVGEIVSGMLAHFPTGTVEEIDGRVFQRAFGQAELENGISHCTPLWDQIRVRNSGKPYRRGVHARSSFCTLHGRLPRRSVR